MASVSRPYRLVNPGRKRKRNAGKRLSLKQKLFFGSARQRAAARVSLKGNRGKKKNTHYLGKAGALKSLGGKHGFIYTNGRRRKNVRKNVKYVRALGTNYSVIYKGKNTASQGTKPGYLYSSNPRKKRKKNIGQILTVFNPGQSKNKLMNRGKRSNMAKRRRRNSLKSMFRPRRRRRSNPSYRRRRRSNPVMRRYRRRRVVARRSNRRRNPGRVRHYSRRRNPGFLTGTAGKIVGVLGGAALTSLLTSTLAGSVSAITSGIPLYIAGAVIAFLQGKLVDKFMHNQVLGENMQVGGYAFVVLTVLHDMVPSLPNPFSNLNGLGLLTTSNNWGPPWVNVGSSMTRFVRPGGTVAAFPAPVAPASMNGMRGMGRLRRGGRLA